MLIYKMLTAGIVMPFLFKLIWFVISYYPHINRYLGEPLNYIQLVFYPSSIFLIGGAGDLKLDLFILSVIVNILYYFLIGVILTFIFKIYNN